MAPFDLAVRAPAAASASPPLGGLNGYWGQMGSDSMKAYCDNNPEYITISFVNSSPENEPSGWPGTNFAGHCPGDVYSYNTPSGQEQSNLWKNCYLMMEGIPYCQQRGVKVLLSIGGVYSSTSNYAVTTEANGRAFAEFLYAAFGPLQPNYSGPRPFDGSGYSNKIDGFDFDIEAKLDNAPYTAMINRFRQLDSSLVITAAPQCPLADEWSYMKGIVQNAKLDALFVQFYNNPDCDFVGSSTNPLDNSNYKAWETFLSTTTYNQGTKLYVGLPADPSAAGSGYVSASAVKQVVQALKGRSSFGGVSLWDFTRGASNTDAKTGLNYNQLVQNVVNFGDTVAPTTGTTVAAITSSRITTTTSSTISSSSTSTTSTSASMTKTTTTTTSPASTSTNISTTTTTKASTSTKPTIATTTTTTTFKSISTITSTAMMKGITTTTNGSTSTKPTSTSTTSSKPTTATSSSPSSTKPLATVAGSNQSSKSTTTSSGTSSLTGSTSTGSWSSTTKSTTTTSGSTQSSSPTAIAAKNAILNKVLATTSQISTSSTRSTSSTKPTSSSQSVPSRHKHHFKHKHSAAFKHRKYGKAALQGRSIDSAQLFAKDVADNTLPSTSSCATSLSTSTPTLMSTATTLSTTKVRTLTLCHASVSDCTLHSVTTELSSWTTTVTPSVQTSRVETGYEGPDMTTTVKSTTVVYSTIELRVGATSPVSEPAATENPASSDSDVYQISSESTSAPDLGSEPYASAQGANPDSNGYQVSLQPSSTLASSNNPDAAGYQINTEPTNTLVSLSRPDSTGYQVSPGPTNTRPLGVAVPTGGCAGESCSATPYTYTPPVATATGQPVTAGASSLCAGLAVVMFMVALQILVW